MAVIATTMDTSTAQGTAISMVAGKGLSRRSGMQTVLFRSI